MKHLKSYNDISESILVGLGIAALSLLGINKLLGFINKKMRDTNFKTTMQIFVDNEDNLNVRVEELQDKISIKITSLENDVKLDLTLIKNTKELITDNSQYVMKLSDEEYDDLLTIIKYYQTKWVNNPKW